MSDGLEGLECHTSKRRRRSAYRCPVPGSVFSPITQCIHHGTSRAVQGMRHFGVSIIGDEVVSCLTLIIAVVVFLVIKH